MAQAMAHAYAQGGTRQTHAGGWSDERVEALKSLWTSGLSASQVAKELGGGVTRNAVIAKVHRLNLPERSPLVGLANHRDAHRSRKGLKPAAPAKPKLAAAAVSNVVQLPQKRGATPGGFHSWRTAPEDIRPPVPQSELRQAEMPLNARPMTLRDIGPCQCRFPLGDGPHGSLDELLFCGAPAPAVGNTERLPPYCETHMQVIAPKATEVQKAKSEDRHTQRLYTKMERRFSGGRA